MPGMAYGNVNKEEKKMAKCAETTVLSGGHSAVFGKKKVFPFPEKKCKKIVIYYYTPAEGIMISVRSLQRSDGDVSDPVSIYILD